MGNKKGLSFLAKPLFLLVVLGAGLEPAHLAARDFKSLVSTNFTIRALGITASAFFKIRTLEFYCLEAEVGIEPA